jgi:prepilin-type N-terminal cleavage/methylation domain-containing protein
MKPCGRRPIRAGLTLIELLCVIAIILVLAGLVLGPAGRALQRVRADKWGEDSSVRLQATVEQLRKHFQGRQDFAPVTLESIEAGRLVGPLELDFLKDHRVTFIPFAGADPDEQVVIRVKLERGYLTEPGQQTATKGEITEVPE